MIEIFKDIKDLEGKYQVSNFGQILSLNYHQTGKSKLLCLTEDKDGYLRVGFWKNGKSKMFYVHRLVAEAFLPNPDNKPQINHKIEGDEGKKINMVFFNEDGTVDEEKSTIEWVTAKENNNYGTRTKRLAKAQSKPVLQFTLDGKFVREWESFSDCEKNGFCASHICKCCQGKRKTHKGFRWKYKE